MVNGKSDEKKISLMELAHDFFSQQRENKNSTIKLIIIYQEPKVSQTSDGIDDDT